jgi:hypothetical protein
MYLHVDRLEGAVVRQLGRAGGDADHHVHLGTQQQVIAGA